MAHGAIKQEVQIRLDTGHEPASEQFLLSSSPLVAFLRVLPIIGCLLIVGGAKLWLIRHFGSATPFWDQWDVEAQNLFKPYLEGTLTLPDLFQAHNEHRLFFSRVLGLLLLELSGFWDPILQLIANVFVQAASLVVLFLLLSSVQTRAAFALIAAFVALIFGIPLGWESPLTVLQSQYLFLNLLAFSALIVVHGTGTFSMRWWAGLALGVLAFLCMASGALVLMAVLSVGVIQAAVCNRRSWRDLSGFCLIALAFGLALLAVPSVSHHAEIRAQSINAFVSGFQPSLSWPLPPSWISAVTLNLPTVWFVYRVVRERASPQDPRWLYVSLGAWLFLQAASLAYGRSGAIAPRYVDIIGFLAILNFASLVYLVEQQNRWLSQGWTRAFAAVWIILVASSFGRSAIVVAVPEISRYRAATAAQTENLRNFVLTADFTHLTGKPLYHIPYPSPERLRDIVSDQTVRSILPMELTGGAATAGKASFVLGQITHRFTARTKRIILKTGPTVVGLGVALFFVVGVLSAHRQCRSGRARPVA